MARSNRVGLLVLFTALSCFLSAEELIGVSNPQQTKYHWVMHCRGCHQMDASGSKGGAPNMAGVVARFLHIDRGRAFLGRVPGVAFVALSDQEVAELLNWMVQTFDAEHMPEHFSPYTSDEVDRLRQQPLITSALSERKALLTLLREKDDHRPGDSAQ